MEKLIHQGPEVKVMVLSYSGLTEEAQMKSHICLAGVDSKSTAGNYLWLAFKTQSEGSNVSWKFHILNPQIEGKEH